MADMKQKIAEALKILNPESRSVSQIHRDLTSTPQTDTGPLEGTSTLKRNCQRNDGYDT